MILSQAPIKKNFRQYLFSFFLIYLFIWVISGPILYTQFKRRLVQSIQESNQQALDKVSESIETLLEELSSLFLYLAMSVEIEEVPAYFQNMDITMMNKTLEDILNIRILYGDQLSVTVYFRSPEIVLTTESGLIPIERHAGREFLRNLANDYVKPGLISRSPARSDHILFTMVRPLPLGTTDPTAFVVLDVHEPYLARILSDLNIPSNHLLLLTDENEELIIGYKNNKVIPAESPDILYTGSDHRHHMVFSTRVEPLRWHFSILTPLAEITQGTKIIRIFFLQNVLLSLFACVILSYFLAKKMNRPIQEIVSVMPVELPKERDILSSIRSGVSGIIKEKNHLQERLARQLPVLRNAFLNRVLTNPRQFGTNLTARLRYYGIAEEVFHRYALLLITLNRDMDTLEESKNLLLLRMHGVIRSSLGGREALGIIILSRDADFAFLVPSGEKAFQELRTIAGNILDDFRFETAAPLIASSSIHSSFFELAESFQEARIALSQSYFLEGHPLTIFTKSSFPESFLYLQPFETEDDLLIALKKGEGEQASLIFRTLLAKIVSKGQDNREAILYMSTQLLNMMIRLVHLLGKDPRQVFGERDLFHETLQKRDTGEIASFFTDLFQSVTAHFRRSLENPNMEKIDRLKGYIETHYAEDLSLASLSSLVYMSVPYLSKTFKDLTGISLKKYVNLVRMTEAKKMLLDPDMKIRDVAKRVGYDNVHAFIRQFKDFARMTPTDYRKSATFR